MQLLLTQTDYSEAGLENVSKNQQAWFTIVVSWHQDALRGNSQMRFDKFFSTVVLTICVFALGCEPPKIEPLPPLERDKTADVEPKEPEVVEVATRKWVDEAQLPSEIWYIQYQNGVRIGYFRTAISKPDRLVNINQSGRYHFRTGSDKNEIVQNIFELESLEYPDGRIARFKDVSTLRDNTTEIEGQLTGEVMKVTTKEAEETKRNNVKWEDGTWGILGIQSMLLANPMKPGEHRSCKFFLHKLNPPQIVPTELIAGQPAITTLAGGKTETLIPVETAMKSGENVTYSTNYINDRGVIYKTVAGSISTFYAPRDVAIAIANEMELGSKLGKTAIFYGLAPAEKDKTAVYMVEGSKIDLYAMWDKKVRQVVKSISALSSQVTVADVTNSQAIAEIPQDEPTELHLGSSKLVNSDHTYIEELAAELFGEKVQPSESQAAKAERVLKLTKSVATAISELPETASISSSIYTARKRKGNNTAKAILLTALLRNRGIPTRLASGMKVDGSASRLKYYLWPEAWIGSRWLPMDASEGKVAGPGCLKMLDTALEGNNPYTSILPVYGAMDNIKVTLTESN